MLSEFYKITKFIQFLVQIISLHLKDDPIELQIFCET